MELFGSYTSPFVRHCRIALLETKTKFSFTETDFETSAKLSPAKKVPFLTNIIRSFRDSYMKAVCKVLEAEFPVKQRNHME